LNEFEVKGESEAQVFSATFSSISVLFLRFSEKSDSVYLKTTSNLKIQSFSSF